jgi:hypothetical protein
MGHIRTGRLPQTRQWKQVVALFDGGAGTLAHRDVDLFAPAHL